MYIPSTALNLILWWIHETTDWIWVSVLLLHNVPQLDMVASNSYIISFKFKVNSSSDLLPPGLFPFHSSRTCAEKNYGCCILAAYLNLVHQHQVQHWPVCAEMQIFIRFTAPSILTCCRYSLIDITWVFILLLPPLIAWSMFRQNLQLFWMFWSSSILLSDVSYINT